MDPSLGVGRDLRTCAADRPIFPHVLGMGHVLLAFPVALDEVVDEGVTDDIAAVRGGRVQQSVVPEDRRAARAGDFDRLAFRVGSFSKVFVGFD